MQNIKFTFITQRFEYGKNGLLCVFRFVDQFIYILCKQSYIGRVIVNKFNLELAEELDLTADTVSHHMNELLTNKLVDIEKKEGRVYYTLSKETLSDLIEQISTIFRL